MFASFSVEQLFTALAPAIRLRKNSMQFYRAGDLHSGARPVGSLSLLIVAKCSSRSLTVACGKIEFALSTEHCYKDLRSTAVRSK